MLADCLDDYDVNIGSKSAKFQLDPYRDALFSIRFGVSPVSGRCGHYAKDANFAGMAGNVRVSDNFSGQFGTKPLRLKQLSIIAFSIRGGVGDRRVGGRGRQSDRQGVWRWSDNAMIASRISTAGACGTPAMHPDQGVAVVNLLDGRVFQSAARA